VSDSDALRTLMEADRWIDRVTSQRSHLPEIAELATLEDELRGLLRELQAAEAVLEPLGRDYEAAAEESARLRKRAGDLDGALATSTNSRELTALQGELTQVRERLSTSEDRELELLVALEPLQGEVAAIRARAQPGVARRAALRASIDELQASLDEELVALRAARVESAAAVPLALLARYDAALARVGTSGAAQVVDGRCDGCRIALAPLDLDRWKAVAPGAFVDCPECGRLLLP
jgi:predicted  nucleic acid-binding Zn-ribbon protein